MYFVFNKSHMFVRLNLVANLMYIIYINNTLPLATDLYMKLYTELGRLCRNQRIYFRNTDETHSTVVALDIYAVIQKKLGFICIFWIKIVLKCICSNTIVY